MVGVEGAREIWGGDRGKNIAPWQFLANALLPSFEICRGGQKSFLGTRLPPLPHRWLRP